jgi:hypothetical protein
MKAAGEPHSARRFYENERGLEKKRIFWRGDRVEWILARGFDAPVCHSGL